MLVFFFQPKTYIETENLIRLKTRKSYTLNFFLLLLLLLLLFCYCQHASPEIFIAAVVNPSTLGTYSMNPCNVSHQTRHHPFSHLAAWEASQCMKNKTEEGGHHVFCIDSLQQITSVQQNTSDSRILLCVFFLPLTEWIMKWDLIHRVIWRDT